MNTPNYYAIIPANVRYDKELSFLEKFLYCEVTALSNVDGYCFASNKYFADLYDKDQKTISRALSNLESKGYVSFEYEKVGARVTKRKIFLTSVISTGDKIVNRAEITSDKNVTREQEKFLLASDKIVTDNNVSYNYLLSLIMYNLPKDQKELIKEKKYNKSLEDEIYSWCQYKKERGQAYKQRGIRELLDRVDKILNEKGEQAAIDAIKFSMASNFQGLYEEKSNNYKATPQPSVPKPKNSRYTEADIRALEED